MSDSEDSTITYTIVSSPFGGLSDIGPPGVDGLHVMPEDPYAYVVAAFQAPPSPDYVPCPEYPPSPDHCPLLPQLLLRMISTRILRRILRMIMRRTSPIVLLTGETRAMMKRSQSDDDIDIEGDGEEDESFDDDEDDDIDIDIEDDEEEDEYLASADSTAVALPAVDHEPFETGESATTPPPHPAYRVTARMSIRPQTPISLPSDTEIARLIAIPTPPPSPLFPLSSPLPQIPSPPLPLLSPPPTDPTYEEAPLGYRTARLRWRAEREDIPEVDLPFRRERGEGSTPAAMEVGYGITDAWDELVGAIQKIAPTTMGRVNQRVAEIFTTFDRETSMIYAMIEEKRDDQAL
uniref:Reverse transcriptase domain-containing protein n=1 Tax=Tanacetum cinerariifolium TaxID=118510 RepID=A0A699I3M4_TANCI|nr:hypothetical protein [Tanacetum cinerariifolium]